MICFGTWGGAIPLRCCVEGLELYGSRYWVLARVVPVARFVGTVGILWCGGGGILAVFSFIFAMDIRTMESSAGGQNIYLKGICILRRSVEDGR